MLVIPYLSPHARTLEAALLDEELVGRWSSQPFDYGVMELSELELREDGHGTATLANAFGDDVTPFTWHCPRPGVLEVREEDGAVTRHPYVLAPAVPAHTPDPVPAVTFGEPLLFCHQYARAG
ncbi:hypothetical protein ACFYOV_08780 [Streptomyces sp. NPDC005931]|uniref:hypothetical protein n=1 Tax=Streptomyces sp. NPDC005931 TaxID=3364737 RepID=UPI00368B5DE7